MDSKITKDMCQNYIIKQGSNIILFLHLAALIRIGKRKKKTLAGKNAISKANTVTHKLLYKIQNCKITV